MSEGKQDEVTQQDEDSSDDGGLWNEFESCATSVTHLYRNCNWRTLQSAAASTTQLYKHGLETKKRSYDRGFTKGRLKLAREISAMCRYKNKIDVGDLVALFSKYDLLPTAADAHHHHHHHGGQSPRHHQRNGEIGNGGVGGGINAHPADGVGNPNAVFLFQEALAPVSNPSASPHRNGNGGLGSFLQNQVCRHRKRPHSPGIGSSPCGPPTFDIVSKRFKRL